jgi:hypothetical protein
LGQPGRSKLSKFIVNQRQKLLGGLRITLLNLRQDAGDVRHETEVRSRKSKVAE